MRLTKLIVGVAGALSVMAFSITVPRMHGEVKEGEKKHDTKKIREKVQQMMPGIVITKEDKFEPKKLYAVNCINRTNWSIVAYKVDNGMWTSLPRPIGRTCDESMSCVDCKKNEKWTALHYSSCGVEPYKLWVMTKDKAGVLRQWGPAKIAPDCEWDGEAFCLDDQPE